MASPDKMELRLMLDRDVMELLDMYAMSKGKTKTDISVVILRAFLAQKQHEAMMLSKVARVSPPTADSGWGALE